MSSSTFVYPPGLAQSARPLHSEREWATVRAALGSGLACFLAQWGAVSLWVSPARVSTVWIPGGLMLALAMLNEPRRWPAVMFGAASGTMLLFVALGLTPPAAAVLLGFLACVQTVAIAGTLRVVLRRPLALVTLGDFLTYCAAIGGSALMAATLLLLGVWAVGIRPATFMIWRTFALAVVLGYLTTTPTVVLLVDSHRSIRGAPVRRWLEAGLLGLLLVLVSGFMIPGPLDRMATWSGIAMSLPPLLLWAAMRFGTLGVSTALFVVTVVATNSTTRGHGPFVNESPADNTLSLQLFILGTGVPLLGLAVVLSEQQRTRDALKATQSELRGLSRELIAAREEEGTRIARELHDDVGQRLALVMFGLSRLRQSHPEAAQLQEQTSAIAHSLRQISHQLHPAALEHAGLAPALEVTCVEVRRATGLVVRLVQAGETTGLPPAVALCLYRVAQEALANVVRHAGARQVALVLRRGTNAVDLEITDDGRGLGLAAPGETARGLGLRSAGERVAAVGGTLTLADAEGAGTTVRVTIPLAEIRNA